MGPEGSREDSHGMERRCRRGGDAADSSALRGHQTRQVAPCAQRDGAGSQDGVDSHLAGRHRSHAEPHEMTVSGPDSCEVGEPCGGVAVAAVGDGDKNGVSEACGSGDMCGHSRGCRHGSDDGCALLTDWETWSATCSCRFLSAVNEGS